MLLTLLDKARHMRSSWIARPLATHSAKTPLPFTFSSSIQSEPPPVTSSTTATPEAPIAKGPVSFGKNLFARSSSASLPLNTSDSALTLYCQVKSDNHSHSANVFSFCSTCSRAIQFINQASCPTAPSPPATMLVWLGKLHLLRHSDSSITGVCSTVALKPFYELVDKELKSIPNIQDL